MNALFLFVLAQLVCFGIMAPRLGFYHDDWSILELAGGGESFWAAFKAYAASEHFFNRPLEVLQFPLLISIGQMEPLRYHIILAGLEILEAWLLFRLFQRLIRHDGLALSAALLAQICPNRAITHVWMVNSPQTVAFILALLSLLAHLDWIETRKPLRLALSLFWYMLSVLNYEASAFLPLFLAGAFAARKEDRPKLRLLWPYAAALAVDVWWQWPGLEALGVANPKSVSWPGEHMLKALGAGLECLTNRIIHICARSFIPAFEELGLPILVGGAAFAAALVHWGFRKSEPLPKDSLRKTLGCLAGGFFGAYLPYAVSSSYMPQVYGIMSRTNGIGAWVAGLLWALGIASIRSKAGRRALAGLVVAAFTWADWHSGLEYAGAWELEKDILSKIAPKAEQLPVGSWVLMSGAPRFVGHAVAFDASWDFPAALRLYTGRKDINADMTDARTRFEKKGVALSERRDLLPYEKLYLFDYPKNELRKASAPPA